MFEVFALTLLIIFVALLLLGVRLLCGKKFIHTHVDGNRALQQRGIHCAQATDRLDRRERTTAVPERRKD